MGFEYGYFRWRPAEALVLWEAQFGDFATRSTVRSTSSSRPVRSGGQHSVSSLLLPHGYEGQGADHSSARIERFLLMGAEEAFRVAQPSSPAPAPRTSTCSARQALEASHSPAGGVHAEVHAAQGAPSSAPHDFTGTTTFRPLLLA